MGGPTVTVIVPVFNGAESIEACIRSLLELDFPREERELIVVDNASSDETPAILDRYRCEIRILHERARGASAARNAGIRVARGKVIAFTDADCTVHPQWLVHLLPPLADETVGIVGGQILSRSPCNPIERFGERIHDQRSAIEMVQPPYAITMNWASRTSVLREVGLFDEGLLRCQDVDLAYRIQQAGYALVHRSKAQVHHLNEGSILGLFREGFVHGKHSVRVRRKHQSFLAKERSRSRFPGKVARFATRWVRSDEKRGALYGIVFLTGKTVGRPMGEIAYWSQRGTRRGVDH